MVKAGAPPKFREAHVNWVFWKIANDSPMGRKIIVRETGLGEGSIRAILEKLDEEGLVKSARSGRALTDNGRKVIQRMKQIIRIERIGRLDMIEKNNNCIVLIRAAGDRVNSGMEQRDAAIKIGRAGATTLVIKKGKLMMPGFEKSVDMHSQYPSDVEKILKTVNPEEGDVIIIGSEDNPQAAEEAAWVAASTLL
jgi:predicted transcriptional regulator